MKNSRVLLINLTNSVCELARHLVHAGINITLHAGSRPQVASEDPKENIFFTEADVGASVTAVLIRYFHEMNPFVDLAAATPEDLTEDISDFDSVIVGLLPLPASE